MDEDKDLKVYHRNYKKTVWGYARVMAHNMDEARDMFDVEDVNDEFDNKSDYEWEPEIMEE